MSTQSTTANPPEHDDYSVDGTEPDAVPEKSEAAGATTEDETSSDLSKAASALGKAGGAAAAAKRKEAREAAEPVAEPEEDPEPVAAKAEEAGNPRHDPKARMLEATRKEAEAKRELHAERQRRQELENRLSALERGQKPEQKAVEDPDPEPKEEDFESYAEFVKNTGRWAARQEHAQLRQAEDQRSQAVAYITARKERESKFMGQLGVRDEADPGWRDRVAPELVNCKPTSRLSKDEPYTQMNDVVEGIVSSEQAPALMLHLTEHYDELQRIAALQTPPEIWREMARLEARLGAATAGASPKPAVKPNPPLRPVSGSAHTADVEPDDDASYDEHVRYHNAKEKRGRR